MQKETTPIIQNYEHEIGIIVFHPTFYHDFPHQTFVSLCSYPIL